MTVDGDGFTGGKFEQSETVDFGNCGTPTSCFGLHATVAIKTDEYPDEMVWTIAQVNGCDGDETIVQAEDGPYLNEDVEYIEYYCLPITKYLFEITDSYGDRINCDCGRGSWRMTVDGNGFTGGEFGQLDVGLRELRHCEYFPHAGPRPFPPVYPPSTPRPPLCLPLQKTHGVVRQCHC